MKIFLSLLWCIFFLSACDSDNENIKVTAEFTPDCINSEGDSFISGTIDFYNTLNFTGNEILTVDLEDTTLQDVSTTKKASYCLELSKETVQPIEFKLFYSSNQIEQSNNYSLQFKFYDLPQGTEYKLKYVNEESISVLTQGYGSYVFTLLSEVKN